ncbi:unnamed protein product [Natator depressus]
MQISVCACVSGVSLGHTFNIVVLNPLSPFYPLLTSVTILFFKIPLFMLCMYFTAYTYYFIYSICAIKLDDPLYSKNKEQEISQEISYIHIVPPTHEENDSFVINRI